MANTNNLTLIKKIALFINENVFLNLLIFVFILLAFPWHLQAQAIVNGYAEITNISGNTLTLGAIDETYHTFNEGDKIIIMQLQDACLTTSTANNVTFGSLDVIQSAGLYEVTTITSRTGNTLVVSNLTNTYNIGPNSSVQIVTFRRLGAPNYTTTGNITGLAWNGQIGGIIAIEVPGLLTLNHNINANGIGFRGGSRSSNWTTPQGCRDNPYISNNTNYGAKGEGIFKNTNTNWVYARGHMLNGGGGGNDHNGGGGGGSNISYGGDGGAGWNGGGLCPAGQSAGGIGGISLAPYISYARIFMGGGGGGAQQNNNVGTNGANGGGIIFLSAGAITANASVSISANGNSTLNGGNDGTGGGGAGGTIILQCNNYLIPNPYTLTITANGGSTGNVGSPNIHGAGGAGGKGAIFFTTSVQPTNTIIQANNGNPGCNNNGSPCNSYGGHAGPGNGIFFLGHGTPLPTPFLNFSAFLLNQQTARIQWHITNNPPAQLLEFTLFKSIDAQNWTALASTPFNPQQIQYAFDDFQLQNGLQYYKLMAVDIDGNFYFSDIQTINLEEKPRIYPVPFQDELNIAMQSPPISIQFYNLSGQLVYEFVPPPNTPNTFSLPTQNLPQGTYFIRIVTEKQVFTQTIIK